MLMTIKKRHCQVLLFLVSVALLIPCSSFAQEGGFGDAANETQTPLAVDVEFQSEPLENVLFQLLFAPERFTIIGKPDFQISGAIRAFTMADAMRELEDIASVLVVESGDRYIVYSMGAETTLGDRSITYVYRARQTRAADLISIVDRKQTAGFPTSNALQATGHAPLGHHAVSTTDLNVSTDALGSGLTKPLGDFVRYQLVPNVNGVLLRGPVRDIRKAVDFLRVIDHPMPIVLVEVLIVQYSHENNFNWRYNLSDGTVLKANPKKFATGYNQPAAGDGNFGPTNWGIDASNVAFDATTGAMSGGISAIGSLTSQFKHNLTLLMEENLARVVTNPHIAVLNGQSGTITLDEKFNFTNTVVTNSSASVQAEAIDAVTALIVTPTVISPDQIHIAVNAELGVFGTVAQGSSLPGQRTNELGTSIVLAENETIIIGGLVKEEIIEARDKIPGAAKVPLVGHLFRGETTQRRYTETVIYITPHLSQPQGYEDQYMKQVFEHTQHLQQRGEEIRMDHRLDTYRSKRLYRHNEQVDRQEYKQYLKEGLPGHVRGCRCRGCLSEPYYEVDPGGEPTNREELPSPEDPSWNEFTGSQSPTAARVRIGDQQTRMMPRPNSPRSPVARASYDHLPATSWSTSQQPSAQTAPAQYGSNQLPSPSQTRELGEPTPKPEPNAVKRLWNFIRRAD